jgi:pseudouridylate synthase
VSARVEEATEAAALARLHWEFGRGGLLLARPPDESLDVEPLITEGVAEAERLGIRGQEVTPFLLSFLHRRSDGRTVEVNKRLIVDNAGLAAEVAVAYAAG